MTASVPPGAPNTAGPVPGDGPDPYRATQGEKTYATGLVWSTLAASLDIDIDMNMNMDPSTLGTAP